MDTHRIHGAGIYANIWGILMVNVTTYSIHGSYGIFSALKTRPGEPRQPEPRGLQPEIDTFADSESGPQKIYRLCPCSTTAREMYIYIYIIYTFVSIDF